MSGLTSRKSSIKENCAAHVKKEPKPSKLTYSKSVLSRNPLSTLSDNVPLSQSAFRRNDVTRKPTSIKNITKKNNVHSRSTSEIERKLHSSLANVTSRTDNAENVRDEVFVDGAEHFLNYLPDKKQHLHKETQYQEQKQEITLPLPVVRTSGAISELVKKTAKKVTLVRKLQRRQSSHCKNEKLYADCLFNEEYFMDNYKYMLRTEGKFVYRKSFLTTHTNYSMRLLMVNWLVYIQQVLELSETTLFAAVRMLDYMSIKLKISSDRYGLVAIVCIWIVSKVYDSRQLFVPKLYALCNGRYSRNQIISTEKEILKIIDFKLDSPDPLVFLYYYLKEEKLETDSKILYSSMFLLEIFTFMLEFSSSAPSLLVATAVYLVFLKYEVNCERFLRFIDFHLVEETAFKHFSKQMSICVKEILNCKCFNNEVIAKYSVQEKLNVAQLFISDLS